MLFVNVLSISSFSRYEYFNCLPFIRNNLTLNRLISNLDRKRQRNRKSGKMKHQHLVGHTERSQYIAVFFAVSLH